MLADVQALNFLFFTDSKSHHGIEDLDENKGRDGTEYEGRQHTDDLRPHLSGVAIQYSVGTVCSCDCSSCENSRQQSSQSSPHPVHPEGIQRIVVPQSILQ